MCAHEIYCAYCGDVLGTTVLCYGVHQRGRPHVSNPACTTLWWTKNTFLCCRSNTGSHVSASAWCYLPVFALLIHCYLVMCVISDFFLRTRRLRWYGHVQRATSCINSITRLELPGTRDRGRPRKTWSACVRNDMTICNLDGVNPLDRNSRRTSVRRCQVLPTPESGTTAAP